MTRLVKLALPALFAILPVGALAQTSPRLSRQLSYLDLGVQAAGQLNSTVSGPITIPATDQGQTVSQFGSNTVGALVTLRYSPRPYLGAEINGGYARYTENYNVPPYQIQTSADEFTFGYLVVPPYTIFGVKPYASAGVGFISFGPTKGGGQGAPKEDRNAYYYNVGAQKDIVPGTFGVRVGFRQVFFVAPDFYQNYLTINKHTSTVEPTVGFYLHF